MATKELTQKIEAAIENISGFPKAGIEFKDITPIFLNPELYKEIIEDFANHSFGKIDVVCGIESRGYLFGIAIAVALGVPFILIRKKGKLPPPLVSQKYDLEYGSSEIEMRAGQLKPGQRVLIHDDLLATGGTTEAAAMLVEKQGATVSQFSFLIALDVLKGDEKLLRFTKDIYSICHY